MIIKRLSRSVLSANSLAVGSDSSGISTPYLFARNRNASGYEKCSFSIKKVTTEPPLPVEKHLKICFAGETTNEGVFSSVKGLKPFKFDPALFKFTNSPITSSI